MKYPRVFYAKAVYDHRETERVLKVLQESPTLMAGPETLEFEKRVSRYFGKKHGVMVNSGSSANAIAVDLLDLPRGSEIITPLLTFSTTVAPLVQRGLVPVFVDVETDTFVPSFSDLAKAMTTKTRAIMIPALLGNLPDLTRIRQLGVPVILDCCDTFAPKWRGKKVGGYADIITTSFYASHIITAGGNGGMVMVDKKTFDEGARMLRGWGRSSSLFAESEDIKKRFSKKIDGAIYDGKFIFSKIGYNFWPHEMGSAFGNVQLDRFPSFKKRRKKNFNELHKFFSQYSCFLVPYKNPSVDTAWLAFPLIYNGNRLKFVKYLERHNIQTRPIFTGNILKQPGFEGIKRKTKGTYKNTNYIMKQGVLIGCHQGLSREHLNHIKSTVVK